MTTHFKLIIFFTMLPDYIKNALDNTLLGPAQNMINSAYFLLFVFFSSEGPQCNDNLYYANYI